MKEQVIVDVTLRLEAEKPASRSQTSAAVKPQRRKQSRGSAGALFFGTAMDFGRFRWMKVNPDTGIRTQIHFETMGRG